MSLNTLHGGGRGDISAAKHVPQIEREVQRLQEVTERLKDSVIRLSETFSPVLRPPDVSSKPEKEKVQLVPLASVLDSIYDSLTTITEMLEDLRSNCEL